MSVNTHPVDQHVSTYQKLLAELEYCENQIKKGAEWLEKKANLEGELTKIRAVMAKALGSAGAATPIAVATKEPVAPSEPASSVEQVVPATKTA